MAEPMLIAKAKEEICLLPGLANRHGLITGATGTGKTVTLQRVAEAFSRIGVPVFMADVKGDLSGLAKAGELKGKIKERVEQLGIELDLKGCPVAFWDVYGKAGPSGPRDRFRHGSAAVRPSPRPERHAAGCADARLQDRRRQQLAAPRSQGPARDAPARGGERQTVPDRVRQHLGGVGRRPSSADFSSSSTRARSSCSASPRSTSTT